MSNQTAMAYWIQICLRNNIEYLRKGLRLLPIHSPQTCTIDLGASRDLNERGLNDLAWSNYEISWIRMQVHPRQAGIDLLTTMANKLSSPQLIE